MVFTEFRFLLFFLIVFALYWSLRSNALRKIWLLATSLVFYGAWDWRFLSVMLFSSSVDFYAGRALGRVQSPGARKALLAVSVATNLGLLGFFKYYNFFIGSASQFLAWIGLPTSDHTLCLILPLGISFYTFQALSYTIDVYRRSIRPVESLSDFLLFVTFFPQNVAGPIVRASEFLPQLVERKFFRNVQVRVCLALFLYGFIKKACLSDNIAPLIDPVFAHPDQFTVGGNWIAILLYQVQLYCDFSGYSDMAVATAGLLGYQMPMNFNFPFFIRNISQFWSRWHISLSTWFRDYLFISLGGSRGSGMRAMAVGVATMMTVGLWHGAGWQFIGFGVLMSSAIVISRVWGESVPEASVPRSVVSFLGPLIMNWFLWVNWIVFRAVGWGECMAMFRKFLFLDWSGTRTLSPALLLVYLGATLVHVVFYFKWIPRRVERLSDASFSLAFGASAAVVLVWMAIDAQPFVYFQF